MFVDRKNMTELVKVDVQCPFCGECYRRMVKIKPSHQFVVERAVSFCI